MMLLREFVRPQYYLPLISFIILSLSPFFLTKPFHLHILTMVFFYAALGSAWNIIGGYGGQLSIGHTAFFGIGAYTSTLLYLHFGVSPWWGMVLGALLSMIFAALVGYPSFRLHGPFFALSTIAFAEVMHIAALNWRGVTEGALGLVIQFNPAFQNFIFKSKVPYVYIAMGLLFLVFGITLIMEKSRFGYYLRALREDDDGARALGINTARVKLRALIMSAFFTSLGGTFYAQYFLLIDPYTVFSVDLSIQVALVSIIGGIGTALGPSIGALVMTPLSEFLRAGLGGGFAGLHLVIYGTILILVVRFLPQGIMEGLQKRYRSLLSLLPDIRWRKTPPSRIETPPSIPVTAPGLSAREPSFSCLLEVQDVTKRFGGLAAVSKLSFQLRQKEILGLIGPNGAGKTTAFNLLSGFYAPNEGDILYKGRKVGGFEPYVLCQLGIGRTFQIAKPFGNLSLIDNVTVGAFCRSRKRMAARAQAEEVLRFVGLWQKKDLPAKSITLADKKSLELAKALATQPDLILLDEIMAGLHPREVSEAMALIKKINEQGITVMIIEHVMAAIMSLCHRTLVLHHGEKIAEGTPQEIAKNRMVIEAYLGEEYLIA